jgi:hypothetical protein
VSFCYQSRLGDAGWRFVGVALGQLSTQSGLLVPMFRGSQMALFWLNASTLCAILSTEDYEINNSSRNNINYNFCNKINYLLLRKLQNNY